MFRTLDCRITLAACTCPFFCYCLIYSSIMRVFELLEWFRLSRVVSSSPWLHSVLIECDSISMELLVYLSLLLCYTMLHQPDHSGIVSSHSLFGGFAISVVSDFLSIKSVRLYTFHLGSPQDSAYVFWNLLSMSVSQPLFVSIAFGLHPFIRFEVRCPCFWL